MTDHYRMKPTLFSDPALGGFIQERNKVPQYISTRGLDEKTALADCEFWSGDDCIDVWVFGIEKRDFVLVFDRLVFSVRSEVVKTGIVYPAGGHILTRVGTDAAAEGLALGILVAAELCAASSADEALEKIRGGFC